MKPKPITMVQVYMPITLAKEEVIEETDKLIRFVKQDETPTIMGNGLLEKEENTVRMFGLGQK